MLSTTLLGLANVVLVLVVSLGGLVTGDTGDGTAEGTGHTVSNTGAKVVELTLGLLRLALEVLLAAGLLQRLFGVLSAQCS